ncbi:hypothetical protein [Xenorhabdus doucetiae]|uniref:Pilus assembly protein HofO n=1 Tax=Xenorhabdus doucetiae TaxID=351671 RepID=A0A068QMF8_9GAMM|nr:hypothetical protein [Xenorhabdus doucetiae]TYP07490.1 pilus assembly protein HofO [Xenorhabdus doucetiae]CDG15784.1 conserved protein of unknown function [Xenorhabdus doucetiae]
MRNNYLEWFYRPVWQQLTLQQLLIILLLLGFYFLVWQKNRHEIHALQSNIKQQQHNTILFQQKLAELPSLLETQQQIRRMAANLAQNSDLSLRNTSSDNIPAQNTPILKRLHMPLIRSGSQLMEWKSHKENEQVFWHIRLSLNYGQFLHFLREIQKLQPPLLIKHIAITPVDTPADGNLTVRMVFSDVALSDTTLPNISLPDPADKEKS